MTTFQDLPPQSRRSARASERGEQQVPEFHDGSTVGPEAVPREDGAPQGRRARDTGEFDDLPLAEPLEYHTQGGPGLPVFDAPVTPPVSQVADPSEQPQYRVRDFSPEGRASGRRAAPAPLDEQQTVAQPGADLEYRTLGAPVPAEPAPAAPPAFETQGLTRRELRQRLAEQEGRAAAPSGPPPLIPPSPVVTTPPAALNWAAMGTALVPVAPVEETLVDDALVGETSVGEAAADEAPVAEAATDEPRLDDEVVEPVVTAVDAPVPDEPAFDAPVFEIAQDADVVPAEVVEAEVVDEPTRDVPDFVVESSLPPELHEIVDASPLSTTPPPPFGSAWSTTPPVSPLATNPPESPLFAAPPPAVSPTSTMPPPVSPFSTNPPPVSPLSTTPPPVGSPFSTTPPPPAASPFSTTPPPVVTPVSITPPSAASPLTTTPPVTPFGTGASFTTTPPPTPAEGVFTTTPVLRPPTSDLPDELEHTGSWTPPPGHWSHQISDEDAADPFINTITREVGGGNVATTTSALVLPEIPHTTFSTALDATGEVLLTGSIDLPRSVGAVGADPRHYDDATVDRLFDSQDSELAGTDSAPVRAVRAVSTHTSSRGVIVAAKPHGNRLLTAALITASVMAVGVGGLLVAGFAFNLF